MACCLLCYSVPLYVILFQADGLDVDLVVAHAVDEPPHQQGLLAPVCIYIYIHIHICMCDATCFDMI